MSDSALAIRKSVAPFPGATLVILATYYAAQWGSRSPSAATTPHLQPAASRFASGDRGKSARAAVASTQPRVRLVRDIMTCA